MVGEQFDLNGVTPGIDRGEFLSADILKAMMASSRCWNIPRNNWYCGKTSVKRKSTTPFINTIS